MANNTRKRGFASMSKERVREIASKGGKVSPGNFRNSPERASAAGQRGAAEQSIDAKRLGGKHSHQGDNADNNEE
jgi:uncharacterized protein